MSSATVDDPTRRLMARYLPFIALLIVYAPALYGLVVDWAQDSNYSHGFLIPLVTGWLLWQKRATLKAAPLTTDGFGLAIVTVAGLMFVLGNAGAEYFTMRLSFVAALFGLTLYLFGRTVVKLVWFELAFLCFMIPIPYVVYYALTFPMQLLASKITAGILSGVGMAVYRQGNILHLPGGSSLEVAEACSGMRSLVSLLALGALYAQLTQNRFSAKVILFLSTVPIAVVANVFRVFVTALLVTTVSPEATSEPMHTIMGMSVFVVSFVLLFIFGAILKQVCK
ncbi:MAG: exosortase/archaeosortase family protein [candidate division Zixibacteria bacterium]|nr:exosortase/archaeosortase family protein [candidate division Zixibacteria bacterium]